MQFGIVQADQYINQIAAVFVVIATHGIVASRTYAERVFSFPNGNSHKLFHTVALSHDNHPYSQPVSGCFQTCAMEVKG